MGSVKALVPLMMWKGFLGKSAVMEVCGSHSKCYDGEEGVDWVNWKAERRPYRMNLYRPFPPIHSKWA